MKFYSDVSRGELAVGVFGLDVNNRELFFKCKACNNTDGCVSCWLQNLKIFDTDNAISNKTPDESLEFDKVWGKALLGGNFARKGIFLVGLFLICIGHQEKQAETTERDIWDYLLHLQYRRVETIEKECVCNGRLENVRWTTLAKTRLWVSTGQNKLVWFRHKFGQNNELRRANFKTFFTLKIL